ncbi:c-5 sterol desaturase [Gryganskiella cystojenkinii]|nr:c-5 sterol desaturase [Gryganskiella cystojenkinii]
MDFVLEVTDEYLLNSLYPRFPAIPIPDLVAGLAAIPSWTDFQTQLASSASPLQAITSTLSNVISSTFLASELTLSNLPHDNFIRQVLSLLTLTYIGALVMYFAFATTSYFLVFDKAHQKHPKYLKNQVKLEIQMSMKALPGIAVMTLPWFLGEVRGWSRLYNHIHLRDSILAASKVTATYNAPASSIQETFAAVMSSNTGFNATAAAAEAAAASIAAAQAAADATIAARAAYFGPLAPLVAPFMDGWGYVAFTIAAFLFFTDFGIYWIHRWLHHPLIYKRLHKPHHKWIVPTPFSSHAFHFMDGYSQSVPYHLFVYLVPMHQFVYLGMFTFVNFWSVLIHDGEYLVSHPAINSAAHHSVHHLYFNYNYGQYFTLWDRVGGSYRKPSEEQYNAKVRMDQSTWKKQAKEVDAFDEFGKPTEASDASMKDKNFQQKKATKVL